MTSIVKTKAKVIARLLIFLTIYDNVTSLIIPEELPTILSLIYSNIPPIKKGTDSRLGVGFRLGEHADFQIVVELGPQSDTNPIGQNDAKRRRDAMLDAAMRGDLGPLTRAVAEYQTQRRIQKEKDQLQAAEQKLEETRVENKSGTDTPSSDWLKKWKRTMSREGNVLFNRLHDNEDKEFQAGMETHATHDDRKDRLKELTKLYKSQI